LGVTGGHCDDAEFPPSITGSGLPKIDSWQFTVQLFRDEYRVPVLDPALAAQVATVIELGIPPLLFAGLATRVATLPLLGMIAVIQFLVYPNAWSDHLMWAAALVLVLTRGPGVFSLDHWIAEAIEKRAAAPFPGRSAVT
jgi:putative oxidoreductase